jgi:hypothetical protein
MNIFSLESDSDRFWNLRSVNEEQDWEQIYRFNGTPLANEWRPLAVEAVEEEVNDGRPASDCPHLFAALPVFSGRAVAALRPLLEEYGEILSLDSRDGSFFIFNVLNLIDALDEQASAIVRFPDGKRGLEIQRFVFRQSQLAGVDVFKLPQQPLGRVFVSDKFVEMVRNAGLVGFTFEWHWASDQRSSSPLITRADLQ